MNNQSDLIEYYNNVIETTEFRTSINRININEESAELTTLRQIMLQETSVQSTSPNADQQPDQQQVQQPVQQPVQPSPFANLIQQITSLFGMQPQNNMEIDEDNSNHGDEYDHGEEHDEEHDEEHEEHGEDHVSHNNTRPMNTQYNPTFVVTTILSGSLTPNGFTFTSQNINSDVMGNNMSQILGELLAGFRLSDHSDVILPLTENALKNLEETKYSEIIDENKCDECTICRENFEQDSIVTKLPCKHIFHKDCIGEWLKNYHHKCPVCRQDCGEYSAKTD